MTGAGQSIAHRQAITACVLTRAQNSELPYLQAFIDHYIHRLRFDRILVVYCDHRDPGPFLAAAERVDPRSIEVLIAPRSVHLDRVFDLYLDRVRAFDYCLNVDFDEFLSIDAPNVTDWLDRLGFPRSIALPWLNVAYIGPPTESLNDIVRCGQVLPNNGVKAFSATQAITRIAVHHIGHRDRSGLDEAMQWRVGGRPVPATAHPTGERILPVTLQDYTGEVSQRREAARSRSDPVDILREEDFSFILHLHVRGPTDLLTKAMYQGFLDANRTVQADIATMLRTKPGDLAMNAVPGRFKYAMAARRLIAIPDPWQARLRDLAAARLGPLPIDRQAQRRSFVAGLTASGLAEDEASAHWEDGTAKTLFDALDARYGHLFDAAAVREERQAILGELTSLFGDRITQNAQLAVLTDKILMRAFQEAVDLGLCGPKRVDHIVRAAATRMRSGVVATLLRDGPRPP